MKISHPSRVLLKAGLVLLAGAVGAATAHSVDPFVVAFCGVFWGGIAGVALWLLSWTGRRAASRHVASSSMPEPANITPSSADDTREPEEFDLVNTPRPGAHGHTEEELRWLRD